MKKGLANMSPAKHILMKIGDGGGYVGFRLQEHFDVEKKMFSPWQSLFVTIASLSKPSFAVVFF